ncbi:MAG TPA: putative toxin-antitoxin system toxin component, PIN family [Chromatiaceae bacterium]|nr:putative toxin-antitoxin system toxin component, PIN family [Chromatiaceae bacterium]HIP73162.1 putative toxin-antitoxin system toxin component, PIN family [Anaerolineae bacterium]
MIRAVIDTNLIVSYLLTQSETTSRLIDHWEQGRLTYLISPAMLSELREVVYRPRLRRHMRVDPAVLLDLIEADAEMVPGELILSGVCRDPKDDPFIACAVEGQAAYLVTGDADLLDMVAYQGVAMIRAYDFVRLLDSAGTV